MLSLNEINEEIAAIEHKRNHNPSDLAILSALYTVKDHAFPNKDLTSAYSFSPAPVSTGETLDNYGDSEFLFVVAGKIPKDAWNVMDDLMDTLRVANPRVYDSVMRKLRQL